MPILLRSSAGKRKEISRVSSLSCNSTDPAVKSFRVQYSLHHHTTKRLQTKEIRNSAGHKSQHSGSGTYLDLNQCPSLAHPFHTQNLTRQRAFLSQKGKYSRILPPSIKVQVAYAGSSDECLAGINDQSQSCLLPLTSKVRVKRCDHFLGLAPLSSPSILLRPCNPVWVSGGT